MFKRLGETPIIEFSYRIGETAMTHFNLVRLPNGDFMLSAGSRIPIDAAMLVIARPDAAANRNNLRVIGLAA